MVCSLAGGRCFKEEKENELQERWPESIYMKRRAIAGLIESSWGPFEQEEPPDRQASGEARGTKPKALDIRIKGRGNLVNFGFQPDREEDKVKTRAVPAVVLILALAALPLLGQTASEKKDLPLSLEDAILKALKNNLNLAVAVYGPAIAEETVSQAKEFFLPQLQFSTTAEHDESPSYWFLQAAATIKDRLTTYGATLAQEIPTGGNVSLSFNNYRSDTNQSFQLINPRYGSTLRFDFSQPLLKDFGFKVSRRQIILAENNVEISATQLESTLLDTIYSVEEAYWNLVYAIEDYKVKEQSLQLARDLLEKNKKEVEVGQLAPIEVLDAQATVAQRQADILAAMALILRSQDVLKTVINLGAEAATAKTTIVPTDKPAFEKKEVSLDQSLRTALERNPNLKGARLDIDNKSLNFSVAKNQMLPSLNLQASYWSPGISGTRLVYLNNDPLLGIIIGQEARSGLDAVKDAFKFLYSNWSLGLTLSVPLSTILTRAEVARTRLELDQSQTQLKNVEQQTELAVSDAVRNVGINAQRHEAYTLARELAEQRLAAEEKKLSVGLSTNYFVLDAQQKLADARSLELKSLVDYNLSLAELARVTGTSLQERNITIEQFRK
jgi:outer membrane protein TolC